MNRETLALTLALMQKVQAALERLERAVGARHDLQSRLDAAGVEAAHLRGEISALKKHNRQLESDCKRAALRVEKALARLDGLIEEH